MTLLVKYLIFGLITMVNPQSLKGMLAASIAFLGLGFCSPPAPASEPIESLHKQIICMADSNGDGKVKVSEIVDLFSYENIT